MSLNTAIQARLEAVFKPLGIVAFTNCCRLGCTGTYEEEDDTFALREGPGIYFIQLSLNGMGYSSKPSSCYAHYEDHAYLTEHWDEELKLLQTWCRTVGLAPEQYTIELPPDGTKAIEIAFATPLELEEPPPPTPFVQKWLDKMGRKGGGQSCWYGRKGDGQSCWYGRKGGSRNDFVT